MSIYSGLYNLVFYLKDNIDPKYLFAGIVVLAVLIFMNIGTILWWGLLAVLFYLFYKSKKEGVSYENTVIDKLCSENNENPLCKEYEASKKQHKKLVETISSKMGIRGP